MNSKERVALAMHHQKADRVPVMCQLALGHYFVNMCHRWKPHEIWFTSEAFTASLLAMRERYRFDGILINIPGRDPDWLSQVASIEEAAGAQIIHWKDGARTIIPPDDNPSYTPSGSGQSPYPTFLEFDPDTDIDRLDEWPKYTWGVIIPPICQAKLLDYCSNHLATFIGQSIWCVQRWVTQYQCMVKCFHHLRTSSNYSVIKMR